jgi:cytochrome P450
MLADPKAIKHVMHSAGYHYPKAAERAQIMNLINGNGLSTVQGLHFFVRFSISTHCYYCIGQVHHRQRKIMTPAFTAHQVESFLPLFHRTASKV